jgi:hypothetical protein
LGVGFLLATFFLFVNGSLWGNGEE